MEIHRKDPLALPDAMREMMQPDLASKALEGWRAGLLSGPPTWGVKAFSDAIKQVMTVAESGVAGVVDPVLSKLYKRDRERFIGEVGASFSGAWSAMRGGAVQDLFGELGQIAKLAPEKVKEPDGGRLDTRVGAIGKGYIPGIHAGRLIRTPYRIIQAINNFSEKLAGEQEIHKLAYRQAKLEKKTGNALDLRTRELVGLYRSSDGDAPAVAGWKQKVSRARAYETFTLPLSEENQGALGAGGAAFQRVARKHPWLSVFVPFTGIPGNIAYQTLERTPVGLIKALKSGRSEDMARVMVGTTLGAVFAGMAASGQLTGSGPEDPDARANLQKTGWQPYSIKMGNTWYGYKRLGPASSLIAMGADIHEGFGEKTPAKRLTKYLGSFVDAMANESYLSGLENFGQFIRDPVRYSGQFFKQLEGSVVPAIVRRAAQAVDPTIRKTEPFDGSAIAAGIPFLSRRLPAVVSGTGEEAQRTKALGEDTIGGAARLLPTGFVTESTQKGPEADLERMFHSLGYVPSASGKHVTVNGKQYDYTPEEAAALTAADRRTTASLRAVLRGPEFSLMSPDEQKKYLERRYDRGREPVREKARARAARDARSQPRAPQARA